MRGLFRDKNGDQRVHWHSSKEGKNAGRFWLHFYTPRHRTIGLEWALFRFVCNVGVDVDEDVTLHVSIPGLGALYLSFEGFIREGRYNHEIRLAIFDKGFWWNFWTNRHEWKSTDSKWRRGAWHPIETFLGRAVYSKVILKEEQVFIPLPEGPREAIAKTELCTWKRPRWFAHHRHFVDMEIPRGAPFPGKGENSWDIGEDGIFGMSTEGTSVEKAIGRVVERVLEYRRRYGGSREWRPSETEGAKTS